MRIVLSGGGTGGHVYPALAIAEQCLKEHPKAEFLYIGTQSGLEKTIVAKSGLPIRFESIEITGFRRKLSMENLKTVMRFLAGVRRSKQLIKQFKPDVVIGTGGYVCGPVVYAAAKLNIPTMVHEQNVLPGLTNRFLSRYATCIAVSFKGSESKFPKAKRVVFTGNPRATTVAQADASKGRATLGLLPNAPLVIIVGGSRGAKAINNVMVDIVPLLPRLPNAHFVCITGEAQFEATLKRIQTESNGQLDHYHVVPYIHNMPEVLAAASLIVNRAGASFLAEITALGIPSILIPSPYVTNNHQEVNARWLEREKAAEVVLEKDLTADSLFDLIEKIVQDPIRSDYMSKQSKRMGNPKAAQLFVQEMKNLLRKL
ncbi:undecaprenyldiphospho-muramoylpentapeptide beta-N-acetylglucosaminyltransferase [Paenibacillus psychroresistens]|uniref:UDP-N-acetylglucosamine--N-acetylmuramyl-(pentapeptide) pyrophosphoryl-undecaprenol N-acetylglucosamine transferase n=1 Tax=Paenibacillus psychroresistens TaxID=1778678 RepID=A0A6B8RK90_9BACL|nr:undecaprenyldiphospho-muramoylpentapeptide beta-N-acetylglucosaminyltransferase [Paenibacillus psychroresistens]QGQ95778.1 undecaprenyldiphospho-muramoylpentapeptide beta-N-acetylglucosaminyltransferase [Paenibacillus psychroresistens]